MHIPIKVYEQVDYDTFEASTLRTKLMIPSKYPGDFFLGATYYLITMHSGCRHNYVRTTLSGLIDVFIGGHFQRREVESVPGEQCSKCGRAKCV